MASETTSIADILGPWVEPNWESGLIDRCKNAWSKPIRDLTKEELATFLSQRIAVEHLLPVAKQRVKSGIDDGSEIFEGELEEAIEFASR